MNLKLYWIQVHDLTLASIKARYRKTWAGFVWVIFNPLLLFGVQSLVFKKFLRLEVPDYHLFLLGGLLPWIFISSTILMGTPIFVTQGHLLRSFKINPMVILGAQVLDNFVNFLMSFLFILLPFYFFTGKEFIILLLIPLALIPLLIGAFSMTAILSTLNVFYRDINFVMGFIFSLLFFLTPIFYPKEFIPLEWQWLIRINPLMYFIEPFRLLIHENAAQRFMLPFTYSMLMALGFALMALLTWNRKKNDFYRKL